MLRFLKGLYEKVKPTPKSEAPYKVETPTVVVDESFNLKVVREAEPTPTPVVTKSDSGKMATPKLTKVEGGKTTSKKPKTNKPSNQKPKKTKAAPKGKTEK